MPPIPGKASKVCDLMPPDSTVDEEEAWNEEDALNEEADLKEDEDWKDLEDEKADDWEAWKDDDICWL